MLRVYSYPLRPLARSFSTSFAVRHSHGHGPCDGHTHGHGKAVPGEEFASNDEHEHIHMRESETEKNDSFTFGSLAHKTSLHSHNHSHTVGNPLLIADRKAFWANKGVRITWIGLGINVAMATAKFAGGVWFHSQALIADSVHAVSDMVSDFLTLATVGLAQKPPSEMFPQGFGKVETVGSLAVSSILAMAGLSIGWGSLVSILGPMTPHIVMDWLAALHIHSHSHSHVDVTNVNAAWIAAGSIAAKEWIFRATKKIADETNSNVLLANAWHHRVDSLTSLVALVTITGGHFFGVTSLDAVGGLLVSGLVVKAGFTGMWSAVNELVDRAVPKADPRYKEIETVTQTTLKNLLSNNNSKEPYKIKDLIVMTSGANVLANVTLIVPQQRWENVLTINEFEMVAEHLRKVLINNVRNGTKVGVEFVESHDEKPVDEEVATFSGIPVPQVDKPEVTHTHSHFGIKH